MTWNFEPSVIVGTGLLAAAYALMIGPLRRRWRWGAPVPLAQQLAFYLGSVCILLALVSPLDALGDKTLFSAHMAQHMLLSFVAPPLWLVGTPGWLIRLLVPARFLELALNPFLAFILFNGVMWTWHLPASYDAALAHEWLHIAEHLMFMAVGVIGWFPALKFELANDMSPLLRLIYLFPSMLSCTALAALITTSSHQLYRFYGNDSLGWGLTPLGDQQLGGLAMWLPGDMLYMVLIVWTFRLLLDQTNPEGQQVKL
ncbi:MAG TPA: cytochrome c oxidase assembly protein [Anaerolineales bacterium]|nr:cytochrome c oxidase assembly protein [Anaerolineales bacterium]